ncbi:MAG: hypothetical protein ACKOXB_04505 [Flavobacteriales bacterium]
MRLSTRLFSLLALPLSLSAQPLITNETTEKIYFDDFTDETQNWATINEPTIKALVVEGSYYMERPNSTKSRALMSTLPSISNKFMIKASLMLGPGNGDAQTLGILFLVQGDGSGGFVLEINRKEQFRIRSIASSGQYITPGEGGWLKSKNISSNDFNKIIIKGFAGKFDIYINEQYNFSFQNNDFKGGDFGLLIGPEAKGKVDYFYVYNLTANIPEVINEKETMAATIDSLKKENDSLKLQLSAQPKPESKDMQPVIKTLEEQLSNCEADNRRLLQVVDLLESQNGGKPANK